MLGVPAAAAAQNDGVIAGQVVEGATGKPVSAAIVAIAGSALPRGERGAAASSARITTGTDVRFVFPRLASCSFTVTATRGGYAEGVGTPASADRHSRSELTAAAQSADRDPCGSMGPSRAPSATRRANPSSAFRAGCGPARSPARRRVHLQAPAWASSRFRCRMSPSGPPRSPTTAASTASAISSTATTLSSPRRPRVGDAEHPQRRRADGAGSGDSAHSPAQRDSGRRPASAQTAAPAVGDALVVDRARAHGRAAVAERTHSCVSAAVLSGAPVASQAAIVTVGGGR